MNLLSVGNRIPPVSKRQVGLELTYLHSPQCPMVKLGKPLTNNWQGTMTYVQNME